MKIINRRGVSNWLLGNYKSYVRDFNTVIASDLKFNYRTIENENHQLLHLDMNNYHKIVNTAGWIVFAIAFTVYFFTVERTGSLWDCGEFITGAYKLEVVHPPGAALFLLIGRIFTMIADIFTDQGSVISHSVNLLSGMCSAFMAMMVCWITIILGRIMLKEGREEMPTDTESLALGFAGAVAGLTAAFCTSVWFSAVEGEVYSMSTFFTSLTLWAMIKWYILPDTPKSDRWLVFAVYAAGLSTGVHLLSLLTFPALALFYYFKKYEKHSIGGIILAGIGGIVALVFVQRIVIVGIPTLWAKLEVLMVNGFGLPFHTGIFPLLIILGAITFFGFKYIGSKRHQTLQVVFMSMVMTMIAFSTIGVVVIRANADTPINMNAPSDALRLIPYLNREQYGERPLLKGPTFDAKRIGADSKDRRGRKGDSYKIIDKKLSLKFDKRKEILFPRIGHYEMGRARHHMQWMGLDPDEPLPPGRPNQVDNFNYFFNYQIQWMYVRYFMWNFVGRQNATQGFYPSDKTRGHWASGIPFIDNARLFDYTNAPDKIKNEKAYNKYFFLPFLFGLFGMLIHLVKRPKDFFALFTLFVMTGIGIIIYSNQPPNEPRERDYVLVGSFFTYSIWVGMAVLALFNLLRKKMQGSTPAIIAGLLALTAPTIMCVQNWDDHSRRHHTAASDYAKNFLESCEENAIIFTYGDNDTYPLWYVQEVEKVRTDVRVVNLSLIHVDWYINQLRRRVNDSPPLDMTIPAEAIQGIKRSQVLVDTRNETPMPLAQAINFVAEDHPQGPKGQIDSYIPAKNLYIPVDRNKAVASGMALLGDANVVDKISFSLGSNSAMAKGDLAVLDIISSNFYERPIYFAVTCREESLKGLDDYLQLEGLAMRLVPKKTIGDPRLGVIGKGSVDSEKLYNNVMNKFRWGNFDKREMFVNKSYLPSVESHRLTILRACEDSLQRGKVERAGDLAMKYFEAFPPMNFDLDAQSLPMINILVKTGRLDKAKSLINNLAHNAEQYLDFFEPMSVKEMQQNGWIQKYAYMIQRTKGELIRMSKECGDEQFSKQITSMLNRFKPKR